LGIPKSLDTLLRTIVALVVLPAAVLFYGPLAIALAVLGRPSARVHRVYVGFARLCLRVGGTRLDVHGLEHIEPTQEYVVVSNHESAWDPPCILAALPCLVLRFVVKRPLLRIPVFGHALRATGNLEVVRTQTKNDVRSLREGMARRDPTISILFFAEGTRSRTGALQGFKLGAFATALSYELPILPVGVAGTRPIWPKGSLRLRRGTVAIEVGPPISIEGLTYADRAGLREQARAVVATLRQRSRERLRAQGHDPGGFDATVD
jgi:1-acyl-sn-glycerol-3-phosphate acyltransferase